jgi:Fur family peroxide stress response transcriptional regulator
MVDTIALLHHSGIQVTPQRVAVLKSVIGSTRHPSAEEVHASARRRCPTVSRATVYNTLNLLVRKHLLQTQILKEGTVVFDPNVKSHHHFIDDATGMIVDIPWEKFTITATGDLGEFEIRDYQVVARGKKK